MYETISYGFLLTAKGILEQLDKTKTPSIGVQKQVIALLTGSYNLAKYEQSFEVKYSAEVNLYLLLWRGDYRFNKDKAYFVRTCGKKEYYYKIPATIAELDAVFSEVQRQRLHFEQFIAAQEKIRFLIDDGPNYGNQAANVNFIKRLQRIGMSGSIEVIYINGMGGDSAGAKKIIELFGLPGNALNNSTPYHDTKLNITFIEATLFVSRIHANQVEALTLGMTAALDSATPEGCIGRALSTNSLINTNYANFLNVKTFVMLAPYYRYNDMHVDTRIYLRNNPVVYIQEGSRNQMLITPIATLQETKKYLKNDPQGRKYKRNNPALSILIKKTKQEEINLQPIYGRSIRENIRNFINVILAARYAQLNGSPKMHKPLVIAAFFEINPAMSIQLAGLLSDKSFQTELGAEWGNEVRHTIQDLQLVNHLQIAKLSNPATKNIMLQLKENEILLLYMGKIPKIIFDGLFTQTGSNIWPVVREGASSLTGILPTGKPHIHCQQPGSETVVTWDIDLDLATPALRKRLEEVNSAICPSSEDINLGRERKTAEITRVVGEYIIEALRPNSEISIFFRELKQQALNQSNDRIASACQAAADLTVLPQREIDRVAHSVFYSTNYGSQRGEEEKINQVAVFASAKVSADLISIPVEMNKSVFDYGKWDSEIQNDPLTNEPIFTYRLYRNEKEVGSAEFYGQPLLCSSEDGNQHNIIKTRGILSEFKITNDMKIDEVCRVLPPSLFDRVLASVSGAATHGFLRGGSRVLGFTLQSRGVSPEVANYLSQFAYYGGIFAIRFTAYCQEMQEYESATAYLNAMCKAAFETGQLWLMNIALKTISQFFDRSAEAVERNNWRILGRGIKKAGSLLSFGIFARNAVGNGLIETSAAILTGSIVEAGTVGAASMLERNFRTRQHSQ
jgi:hypothetical protein